MKKISIAFTLLLAVIIVMLSSCSSKQISEETTDNNENASVALTEDSSTESYSFGAEPLAFDVPHTISDVDAYINMPEYDSSKKDGSTETFYDCSKNTVMTKTYDSQNRPSEVTIFTDSSSKKVVKYGYNSPAEIDLSEFKEDVCQSAYAFTFDDAGILNGCSRAVYEDGTLYSIDVYSLDSDGNVTKHMDMDDLSTIITNGISEKFGASLG